MFTLFNLQGTLETVFVRFSLLFGFIGKTLDRSSFLIISRSFQFVKNFFQIFSNFSE